MGIFEMLKNKAEERRWRFTYDETRAAQSGIGKNSINLLLEIIERRCCEAQSELAGEIFADRIEARIDAYRIWIINDEGEYAAPTTHGEIVYSRCGYDTLTDSQVETLTNYLYKSLKQQYNNNTKIKISIFVSSRPTNGNITIDITAYHPRYKKAEF